MSLLRVVQHVRKYQTFFKSVSGAATPELIETQLSGALPSCAILPMYKAQPQENMTGVYQEVIEQYDCYIGLDNTADRAGAASSAEMFDKAFRALTSTLLGWTPLDPDGSSPYQMPFGLTGDVEHILIDGARAFFKVSFAATRIYGTEDSFLNNPLYLGETGVVIDPDLFVGNVVVDANTVAQINIL